MRLLTDLLRRGVLLLPLTAWAVGITLATTDVPPNPGPAFFTSIDDFLGWLNADDAGPRSLPGARAADPFDSGDAAPVIVSARLVCSLANEDAAAASIKQFDGALSVAEGGTSYWLFGDSWLARGSGGFSFANATAAVSTDADAADCLKLTYQADDGVAEPMFPAILRRESTAWPTGGIVLEPGQIDFYFASIIRKSAKEWHVGGVGLGRLDTATMKGRRTAENLWGSESPSGLAVNEARSPIRDGDVVIVFLHTADNRQLAARAPVVSIGSADAYVYWDGDGWSESAAEAEPLWSEPQTGFPAHGGLSVAYNPFLEKWLAVYDRELSGIDVRVADEPTGPWSSEIRWLDCGRVFPSAIWPFLCYYAEQHAQLAAGEGRTVYVTVSSMPPYDVYLFEFRLGAAIHEWRDPSGEIAYGRAPPGEGYSDAGIRFYASDAPVPGFEPVHLWESESGERLYALESPGAAFSDGGIAFYAPSSPEVEDSLLRYEPVYHWDSGSTHLCATAEQGPDLYGFVRGPVAFYAACGDSDLNGTVDCLE